MVPSEDSNFGEPDPVAEAYLGKGFFIDCTLPVFSDPNFRVGGAMAAELKGQGTPEWNVTVGGYGEHGIQAFMIRPLPVSPYDLYQNLKATGDEGAKVAAVRCETVYIIPAV